MSVSWIRSVGQCTHVEDWSSCGRFPGVWGVGRRNAMLILAWVTVAVAALVASCVAEAAVPVPSGAGGSGTARMLGTDGRYWPTGTGNTRAASYVAPPVPCVDVVTGGVPSAFGATAGVAYWTETTGAGTATYAYDLATGVRWALAAGEAPPPYDEVRYAVKLLATPRIGFSVSDRRPVVKLAAVPLTPAWGTPVRLTGTVCNAAGKPFGFARLRLERLDGARWVTIAQARTSARGRCTFRYVPAARTLLRLRFVLPATQPDGATYVAADEPVAALAPRVRLSVPALPASVPAGTKVAASGTLFPRHAARSGAVRVEFQRLGYDGTWVLQRTVTAVLANSATGSRYSASVRLSVTGRWRVRAVHPADAEHATTSSSWRLFTVK